MGNSLLGDQGPARVAGGGIDATTIPMPAAPTTERSTAIAVLNEQLGIGLRRLINATDAITTKLDVFTGNSNPQQQGQSQEPQPGTLASVAWQAERLLIESARLELQFQRLAEIL